MGLLVIGTLIVNTVHEIKTTKLKPKGNTMIRLLLFLFISSVAFASGSHGSHHGSKSKKKKIPSVYKEYKLTAKAKKEATAVYLDTCDNRLWKQDASKVKACPYCGDAMPNCGRLVKILPKRGEKYSMAEYDLPNKICPVSGEKIENTRHSVQVHGKKVYTCCKSCTKKFKKAIEGDRLKKYMIKLPLKPELFGFTKDGGAHDHSGHNHEDMQMNHDSHGEEAHDDHSGHDHSGHDH